MTDGGRHVSIGRVRSVNPARRELHIDIGKGCRAEFEKVEWLRVALDSGGTLRCRVAALRVDSDRKATARLTPGVSMDAVRGMKGAQLVVLENELQPRGRPWDFASEELIDMTMVTVSGVILGTVAGAFETAAHLVIEVEKTNGGSFLLPAVREVVKEIDFEARRIVVLNIEGFAVADENGERMA